jgi:hypothetical protein
LSLGRALKVEYALYGSLRRADSVLAIRVTLVNIASKQEWTFSQNTPETPQQLLGAVRLLASSIAAAIPESTPARPEPPAPLGRLRSAKAIITSDPPGAHLTLNGQFMGTTPYSDSLIPGNYNVHVASAGYQPFAKQVFFPANTRKQLKISLSNPWATLNVQSTPPGAAVAINDKTRGKTPHNESRLQAGRYNIKLSLDGYLDTLCPYYALKGARDTLHVPLVSRDSLIANKKHWKKQRQNARRILLGVTSAGCALAGIVANSQVSQYVEDQKAARDALEQPGLTATEISVYTQDFNTARDAADDAATARNWLYGVAGAFAVGFTVSIFF